MRLILLLAAVTPLSQSYKIRRTNCDIEDGSSTMYCTCGGIGDPFAIILNKGPNPNMGLPFYGTRFGHNFGLQIKQALVDRNRTLGSGSPVLTKVVYHNCTNFPFRLKLDFEEFIWDPKTQVDLRSISEIEIRSVHSVNLYLFQDLYWGNLTVSFTDIHNTSVFNNNKKAGVLIHGNLQYCRDPCQEEDKEKDDKDCTICQAYSSLTLNFDRVDDVLLSGLISTAEKRGHGFINAQNVKTFRVIGGEYSGVTADIDADSCLAFQNVTECDGVLESGSGVEVTSNVGGVVVGAVAVIAVFLIVLGALLATKPKPI